MTFLGFGEISCTKKYVSQYVTSCYLRYLVQRNMLHIMSPAVGDKIEASYQKRKITIASNETKCKSSSGNRIAGLPLREVCAAPARRQFWSGAAHACTALRCGTRTHGTAVRHSHGTAATVAHGRRDRLCRVYIAHAGRSGRFGQSMPDHRADNTLEGETPIQR